MTHLWEVHHPYYATEGNFYSRPGEAHVNHESWADFKTDGIYAMDRDLNLVYRWDWSKPDPEDYTGEPDDTMPDHDTLKLYIMGQRKALAHSAFVPVTEADEPEVRAWLEVCHLTIKALWEPLT